jgi:DNA-binding transcriptional LysR family regulator
VAAVAGLAAGHLDLCCLPTLAAHPGAELIGRFRGDYPAVTVDMSVADDPAELGERLRSGDCELGITEAAMAPSELQHHVLTDQRLVVVLPPGTAWQAGPVSLRSLVGTPFVTTPHGTSTRRLLDESFAAVGAQAEVVVVTGQREAILPLVLAGAGATLLPEPIAYTAVGEGAVIARPRPAIHRTVVLAHRTGPLSPAAAAFVELSDPAAKTPPTD